LLSCCSLEYCKSACSVVGVSDMRICEQHEFRLMLRWVNELQAEFSKLTPDLLPMCLCEHMSVACRTWNLHCKCLRLLGVNVYNWSPCLVVC
jgi:hypothetical protein